MSSISSPGSRSESPSRSPSPVTGDYLVFAVFGSFCSDVLLLQLLFLLVSVLLLLLLLLLFLLLLMVSLCLVCLSFLFSHSIQLMIISFHRPRPYSTRRFFYFEVLIVCCSVIFWMLTRIQELDRTFLKHCQRHYGPRRWLLWPLILVW